MARPLRGVRVLAVADYVFVPAACTVLASLGAEVIKVEHFERGDLMRGLRTFHPGAEHSTKGHGYSAIMEGANRGARSIGLNLAHHDGLGVLLDLARTSDVFVTSKLEPTRRKLGFDVDEIRRVNPRIVYARGTGRGPLGPEAHTGGFDALDFWYRSGMAMSAQASESGCPPTLPGSAALGDLTSGMNLACGIVSALLHLDRTGEALTVDVSLLGSAVWSMGGAVTQSMLYETPARQQPCARPVHPLVNTYRTADGKWIALACMQATKYWDELCRILRRDDLAADERFQSHAGLEEHSGELCQTLGQVFAAHPASEWHERLASFTGQWSPVFDSLEIASDGQVLANGYLQESVSTTGEPLVFARPPVAFDGAPPELEPAQEFNQDGDAILAGLGLSDEQILELKISGAVT